MSDIKKRLAAAKARLRGRHPDKDKTEVSVMVSSFQGLTSEQIRKNFEKATSQQS